MDVTEADMFPEMSVDVAVGGNAKANQNIRKRIKEESIKVDSSVLTRLIAENTQLDPKILDKQKVSIPMSLLEAILDNTKVDERKYIAESGDCDDFAIALAGVTRNRFRYGGIGIVIDYSGRHAYNCAMVHDPNNPKQVELIFIEPQSDGLIKKGQAMSSSESYKMERGFILI